MSDTSYFSAARQAEVQLGLIAAALVTGEAIGLSWAVTSAVWPAFACLTALAAAFGFGFSIPRWTIVVSFLAGLTLAMRAEYASLTTWHAAEIRGGFCEGAFLVTGDPRIGNANAQDMRWISLPTKFNGNKMDILLSQSISNAVPQAGETWLCAGWLDRRKQADSRPRKLWVKGRQAYAKRDTSTPVDPTMAILTSAKRAFSRRMGIGLEDRPTLANLNRAMVLGERSTLPYEMRQDFIHSGTMHVFAISGLHVAVVSQILLYVLVLLLFPIRWSGILLIPALWSYVALIGTPPSAVRAAAMASVYYVAPIFWRKPNALTAWEVTLIGFGLLDPMGLFGVGSMLSFTVMLGILLFLRWARPFQSRVLLTLGIPFAAWAAGVPITAHVFARITPGGLVANLIEIPLASGAVMTSILGGIASFVSHALAAHLNNLAALLTEMMTVVSCTVARIPGADFEIVPWSIPLGAAWYVGIILTFVWIKMVWMRRRDSLA